MASNRILRILDSIRSLKGEDRQAWETIRQYRLHYVKGCIEQVEAQIEANGGPLAGGVVCKLNMEHARLLAEHMVLSNPDVTFMTVDEFFK